MHFRKPTPKETWKKGPSVVNLATKNTNDQTVFLTGPPSSEGADERASATPTLPGASDRAHGRARGTTHREGPVNPGPKGAGREHTGSVLCRAHRETGPAARLSCPVLLSPSAPHSFPTSENSADTDTNGSRGAVLPAHGERVQDHRGLRPPPFCQGPCSRGLLCPGVILHELPSSCWLVHSRTLILDNRLASSC